MNLSLVPAVASDVSVPAEHVEARDRLISQAKLLVSVQNPTSLAKAVELGRKLREIQTSTESARKEVKAPVLDLGQRIDEAAKTFVGPVDSEIRRLIGLVNAFQAAETEKRRAAEAAAEKARRDHQAELDRIAAKARADAEAAARANRPPPPPPTPPPPPVATQLVLPKPTPKPEGIRSAPVWTFEITDLAAFEAADMQRPVGGRLGTYEVSRSAMAAALRQGLREFPGARIFETQSTSFTGR